MFSSLSFSLKVLLIQPQVIARLRLQNQKVDISDILLAIARQVSESLLGYFIELSPKLEFAATFWNTICWEGSLRSYREGNFNNYASELLEACNNAVNIGKTAWFYDGRGVARALSGDRKGAIADFEKAIELLPNNDSWISKQNTRINALRQGKDPFTMEQIDKLLNL